MRCPDDKTVFDADAAVDGSDADLAAHIRACATCREAAQRRDLVAACVAERESAVGEKEAWQRLRAVLGEVEQVEPVGAGARPRGWVLARRWRQMHWVWFGALAATCAALVVVVVVPVGREDGLGTTVALGRGAFTARGDAETRSAPAAGNASERVDATAYRVPASSDLDTAQPERLRRFFYADDFLLFSYTNATSGSDGYRWLVIVGRDAAGKTHWYQPSRAPHAEGPLRAVRLAEASMNVDIPVALRSQHIAAGSMRMIFIFSQREISRQDALRAMQLPPGRHGGVLGGSAAVVVESYEVVHEGSEMQ